MTVQNDNTTLIHSRMNTADEAAGITAADEDFRRFPSFRPACYPAGDPRLGFAEHTLPAAAEAVGEHRPVRRGEVHFHHSLTWHGSADNTSGRERRAHAIHCAGRPPGVRRSYRFPQRMDFVWRFCMGVQGG